MYIFNNFVYDCRKQLLSPKTTMDRERKWLQLINDWDKQMTKNFKKVCFA